MEAKQPEDMQFEDTDFYAGSKGEDFKDIVLRQFKKCSEEGSKEMTAGGVERRVIEGQLIEFIVPNQREIFINHCEMLKILLAPKIKQHNKVVAPFLIQFQKELNKVNVDFNVKQKAIKQKIDDDFPTDANDIGQNNIELQNSLDDYELAKVALYKKYLLISISFLLEHLNYFAEAGATG